MSTFRADTTGKRQNNSTPEESSPSRSRARGKKEANAADPMVVEDVVTRTTTRRLVRGRRIKSPKKLLRLYVIVKDENVGGPVGSRVSRRVLMNSKEDNFRSLGILTCKNWTMDTT